MPHQHSYQRKKYQHLDLQYCIYNQTNCLIHQLFDDHFLYHTIFSLLYRVLRSCRQQCSPEKRYQAIMEELYLNSLRLIELILLKKLREFSFLQELLQQRKSKINDKYDLIQNQVFITQIFKNQKIRKHKQMNSNVQSLQTIQSQEQQTVEHNIKQLLEWLSQQVSKKNIATLTSIQQLASGNIFLEIISIYYPKKVDLTRTFMKPKDDFQLLQNFKQLLSAFNKIGWKKFETQKFRKRKDKDLIFMAQYLKKNLSEHLFNDNNQNMTSVHSILASYPSPDKIQVKKLPKQFIKIQDRKSMVISSHKQSIKVVQNHLQRKNSDSKKIIKKMTGVFPTSNGFDKQYGIEGVEPIHKKQIVSARLPPHPHNSKTNITSVQSIKANYSPLMALSTTRQQQQLNNFQNMKITKLQKQKSLLLKKILQIQQIIVRQKNKSTLSQTQEKQKKIVGQNGLQKKQNKEQQKTAEHKHSEEEKQKIQNLKRQILSILSDIQGL